MARLAAQAAALAEQEEAAIRLKMQKAIVWMQKQVPFTICRCVCVNWPMFDTHACEYRGVVVRAFSGWVANTARVAWQQELLGKAVIVRLRSLSAHFLLTLTSFPLAVYSSVPLFT